MFAREKVNMKIKAVKKALSDNCGEECAWKWNRMLVVLIG